jgi:hypothetical protein
VLWKPVIVDPGGTQEGSQIDQRGRDFLLSIDPFSRWPPMHSSKYISSARHRVPTIEGIRLRCLHHGENLPGGVARQDV